MARTVKQKIAATKLRKRNAALAATKKAQRAKARKAEALATHKRFVRVRVKGRYKRVPFQEWEVFHPRAKNGRFLPKIAKAFPSGKRNLATKVKRGQLPKKLRRKETRGPSGKEIRIWEQPTNLKWNDSRHTEDVVAGMLGALFVKAKKELADKVIVNWRSGAIYKSAKRNTQDEDGEETSRPDWASGWSKGAPIIVGTKNVMPYEEAVKYGQKKVRGIFDLEAPDSDGRQKYRVWILAVRVLATLASPAIKSKAKRVRRRAKG